MSAVGSVTSCTISDQVGRDSIGLSQFDARGFKFIVISRRPAVSANWMGQPSIAVVRVTTSRVVPGIGETIARSKPQVH